MAAAAAAVMVPALLLPGRTAAAQPPANLELHAGARVGVVNLLDAEITHYHASHHLQDSFLKTYPVNWPVHAMLMEAVSERLTSLGLTPVATAATEALRRAREECLLNATLSKGLPGRCGAPFAQLATVEHLDALIVLGPGLNDAAHAAGNRRADLPAYLRGWCVVSDGTANDAPALLNLTELLLIAPSATDASLVARHWGGDQKPSWSGFAAATDLRDIPAQQLEQLKPLFADLIKQQSVAVLGHLQVGH
jgi:hypothetical protein